MEKKLCLSMKCKLLSAILISWDSGKRVVQDLDSSNGTTLNSAPFLPFKPSDLCDNDTLKLGACTSILVRVEQIEETASLQRQLRSRKGKEGGEVETGLLQRQFRPRKGKEGSEVVESKRGRGKPRKAKVVEEKGKENVGPPKKVEEVGKENVGPSLKVRASLGESNVRVRRSRKNLGLGVGKRTRAGARKRKNLPELPPEPEEKKVEGEVRVSENVVVLKEERVEFGLIFQGVPREEKGKEVELDSSSSKEAEAEKITRDVEEGDDSRGGVDGSGDLGEEGNVGLDWEKATLREWFDYIEMYLRKQVMEASEALIEEIRRKAD